MNQATPTSATDPIPATCDVPVLVGALRVAARAQASQGLFQAADARRASVCSRGAVEGRNLALERH